MARSDELDELLHKLETAKAPSQSLEINMRWLLSKNYNDLQFPGMFSSHFNPMSNPEHAFSLIKAMVPEGQIELSGTFGRPDWCAGIRIGNHFGGTAGRPDMHMALSAALLRTLLAVDRE